MSDFTKALYIFAFVVLSLLWAGTLLSQPREPKWKTHIVVTEHPNGVQCHSWPPEIIYAKLIQPAIHCVKVK